MSEIVTIEPPQDRAVTLEEARQQLRLDGRDEDLLLGAKLPWAVQRCPYQRRTMSSADGTGSPASARHPGNLGPSWVKTA